MCYKCSVVTHGGGPSLQNINYTYAGECSSTLSVISHRNCAVHIPWTVLTVYCTGLSVQQKCAMKINHSMRHGFVLCYL